MNLFQYREVVAVRLELEGFVEKLISLLVAILVILNNLCIELKLSGSQMLSRLFKDSVLIVLMASYHFRIFINFAVQVDLCINQRHWF